MRDEIILIGPMGAGKSTVGRIITKRLGLPRVPMDDLRFAYYEEIGYDRAYAEELRRANGFDAVIKYWKPFELHAVQRLLSDYQNCVIDFGAGHSVQEDDAMFARLQATMAPFANVVLLQPDPDVETSLQILTSREDEYKEFEELNRHFLEHPANRALAKHVVYNGAMTAEQTADEVLATSPMRMTPWRENIGALCAAKEDLVAVIEQVPAERREQAGACNDLSARQAVGHLARRQQALARRFDELRGHPAAGQDRESDNADDGATRIELTWDETFRDWNEQLDALMLAIARVTDDDRAKNSAFADGVGEMTESLRFFAQQMCDWMAIP
jgi:shikimate kinase